MAVKFFSTEYKGGTGGDGTSIAVKQVTKMNIIAPHTTTIDIPYTARFDKLPVEVLKMHGEQKDLVDTLADFDNADATDFESNEFVAFDGVMSLEKNYTDNMDLMENDIYEYSFAEIINKFKSIESLSLS